MLEEVAFVGGLMVRVKGRRLCCLGGKAMLAVPQAGVRVGCRISTAFCAWLVVPQAPIASNRTYCNRTSIIWQTDHQLLMIRRLRSGDVHAQPLAVHVYTALTRPT